MKREELLDELARGIPLEYAEIATDRICRRWGGEEHWVPTPPRERLPALAVRNAKILALYTGGADVQGIAARYGLSARHIWRILSAQLN